MDSTKTNTSTVTIRSRIDHLQSIYDFERTVYYETDEEYREELMRTFHIPIPPPVFGPALPVTNEPLTYTQANALTVDYAKIAETMHQIVECTKTDPHMRALYEKAAARLLSTDYETGGILLVSYTAFFHFHICLHVYFFHREEWGPNHVAYNELMRRMSKPGRS